MGRYLLSLATVLSLFSGHAGAQSVNAQASTQALARLAAYKAEVVSIRSVAATPLGPYDLYTQCTYCSDHAWWGFGTCTTNTTETWPAKVDFTWTRSQLTNVLNRAAQGADQFPAAYQPVQVWINNIPAFSARLDNAADVILTVQQQIKNGQGPTDQQRLLVTQALQELVDDLAVNRTQLDNGTRSLAGVLQQQSAYGPAIQQAIAGAKQSAQSALASLQQAANTHHCQDGLPQKFGQISNDFTTSTNHINSEFQKLEASRQAADQAVATLLGALISSRTDLQSVAAQLGAAKNDQLGGFLERLHLAAAKQQWQQIAAYAASPAAHP